MSGNEWLANQPAQARIAAMDAYDASSLIRDIGTSFKSAWMR
jgi:hypothetical protein